MKSAETKYGSTKRHQDDPAPDTDKTGPIEDGVSRNRIEYNLDEPLDARRISLDFMTCHGHYSSAISSIRALLDPAEFPIDYGRYSKVVPVECR